VIPCNRISFTGLAVASIKGKNVRLTVGGNAPHLRNYAAENHLEQK